VITVLPNTTIIVSQGSVAAVYIGEVGKSLTFMLQINSLHHVPNIIEIGQHL